MTRSSFSKNDYEILAKETLFQGFYRMLRYQVCHKKFEGGWSVPFTRELFATLSAVALLIYDPLRDQVVLIEQFRIGALEHAETPWIIENVAGLLMPGESPIDAVKREAIEESGCEVLDIEPIYEYLASPGNSNEYLYLYCGWVDATAANGI